MGFVALTRFTALVMRVVGIVMTVGFVVLMPLVRFVMLTVFVALTVFMRFVERGGVIHADIDVVDGLFRLPKFFGSFFGCLSSAFFFLAEDSALARVFAPGDACHRDGPEEAHDRYDHEHRKKIGAPCECGQQR